MTDAAAEAAAAARSALAVAMAAMPPTRLTEAPEHFAHAWAVGVPLDAEEDEILVAWDLLRQDPHWADKVGYLDASDGETRMIVVFAL